MNLKGNQDQFCFAGTHEYTLVYCKEKSMFTPNSFSFDLEELEEWEEDEIGLYKKGAPLRATGAESNREDRPLMFYPILIDKNNNVSTITEEEHSFIYDKTTKTFDDNHLSDLISNYLEIDLEVILPKVDSNQHGRWRWGFNKNTIKRLEYDVIVSRTKNGISLYKKQRPELGDLPSKKPKSIFYKPEYSSGNGTSQLKDIFDNKIFNNPKPLELIKDFITIGSNKTSIILDFFAGSGTTLHATMQLNAEDGGNRQCILVTNNENNICEEVTYERNKRVIQGYTNAKGVQVEGLTNNNFRYYRSEYVGRDHTHKNKKELVLAATELLCIKEDIYTELTELNGQKLNNKVVRCFSDKGKYMLVIYDEEAIETLLPLISTINSHKKIKIYIFAPGQYPFTEEFEDVLDKVELCALPDAIYKAYANVLPKKKAKPAVYSNEESTESETNEIVEPNLFTV
jgi:adenine-specific DNA-methyltransferase